MNNWFYQRSTKIIQNYFARTRILKTPLLVYKRQIFLRTIFTIMLKKILKIIFIFNICFDQNVTHL